MKKTRYIPYGYTVRNGLTIVERNEAQIVQEIFELYINGSSLKDIAEILTARQVPYTEKTREWDKARIARIIDNAKYIGASDYEPIIEESTYEIAVNTKKAKQRNTTQSTVEGITQIRNKVRCGCCGSMMVRRVNQSHKIQESWECTNEECGIRVKIPDAVLMQKVTLILNRIIKNNKLLVPREKQKKKRSDIPEVYKLEEDLREEIGQQNPSEHTMLQIIKNIAETTYAHSDCKDDIALRISQKRLELYSPSESFQSQAFDDIVSTIRMDENGNITLQTKTNAEVTEEENEC